MIAAPVPAYVLEANAKLEELEYQRNLAFTRCTSLAAVNKVLSAAFTEVEQRLVALQAEIAALRAGNDPSLGAEPPREPADPPLRH